MKMILTVTGLVALTIGLVFGVWVVGGRYLNNQNGPVECNKTGVNHLVTLGNNKASPSHTYAKVCDKLTFINNNNSILLIAFGPHEHHVPYDGITEHELEPGQSFNITLNAAGTYHFHDHLADIIQGLFTVSR